MTGGDADRPGIPAQPKTVGDQLAAVGDLRCQGIRGGGGCESGRSYGTTGMYRLEGRALCQNCAVKALGIQVLSPAEKLRTMMRFLLGGS